MVSAFCFVSCKEDEVQDTTIELARPENITVETELATATVAWTPASKAAGYAYVLDQTVNEENPDISAFTTIPADPAKLHLEGLSKGEHSITMLALGDNDHTTNSLMRSATFTIDPTLPTPIPSYREEKGIVTVSWNTIKGAGGYAYRLSETDSWHTIDDAAATSKTFTSEEMPSNATYNFELKAVGAPGLSEDSEPAVLVIKLVDTSKGVWLLVFKGQDSYDKAYLGEVEAKVFTYVIKGQKDCMVNVSVDGISYEHVQYTGVGGVGPYTDYVTTKGDDKAVKKYAHSSVGRLVKVEAQEKANYPYINIEEACDVQFTLDLEELNTEGGVLRYKMDMLNYEDPSVIMSYNFDLMTWGGHWLQGYGFRIPDGATATAVDGTEPATKVGTNNTTQGVKIADLAKMNPKYVQNRNLEGWSMINCSEFAGYFRLTDGNTTPGSATTPKFGYAGNVVVTFDALQFGGSKIEVDFTVLNGGKIKSVGVKYPNVTAKVWDGGYTSASLTPKDDVSFSMGATHNPQFDNAKEKAWTSYTVTIEGATADTQIHLEAKGYVRLCIDNIVVKKN